MSNLQDAELAPRNVDLIVHAKWILPIVPRERVYQNCGLVVDEGKIIGIFPDQEINKSYTAKTVRMLDQHVLMPGLINAHGHAAMSLLRGFADDLALMDWLENHIWPVETRWVDSTFVRDGTELAIAEMIQVGTTCFSDMYFFPDAVAQTALDLGIRAQVCFPVLDFQTAWAENADDYIHKGLALHDDFRLVDRIQIAFGPHAPYTVADKPLSRIATLAEELQAPIQIHLHETQFEVEEAIRNTGQRPIQRLAALGLLGPSTQCVHMTHLSQADIELTQNHGASVIHCPESNLKLASGLCPVQSLLDKNINVALGTDGAASNNDLDLFGELQTAALVGKLSANNASAIDAYTALELATINGAKALGLDDQIGSLEAGKDADFIAVSIENIHQFPLYNIASQLVYTNSGNHVSDVWVAGECLYKDKQHTSLDIQTVKNKTASWQNKISEKNA